MAHAQSMAVDARAGERECGAVNAGPVQAVFADGRRHFQHGPIDLIVEAFGPDMETRDAYDQAWRRFESVLQELVDELPLLRRRLSAHGGAPDGPTARRMWRACWPHRKSFVTPMAAVAGAVADEVLASMVAGRSLARAYVNDGGDIALYLTPGHGFGTGIVTDLADPRIDGVAQIEYDDPIRGIATSGRGGRSFSLGVADSVTVVAADAAAADAAATLIGNAVDVADPAIRRCAATELDPDSDLGDRLVTVEVGSLGDESVRTALNRGVAVAVDFLNRKLLHGAVLCLQGRLRIVGNVLPSDRRMPDSQLGHG